MSDNKLSPEELILKEWLSLSKHKLLFVIWYLGDTRQLVEIQLVLTRLRNLGVDFHVEYMAINEQTLLAVKLGVKNEVTILMFRAHELLECIAPETGTTQLVRILGKYV